MRTLDSLSDADFRRTILRAVRLLLAMTLVALPFVWWRLGGWRGAAMLLVGATISASGLWEWLRLLTGVMARMDADTSQDAPIVGSGQQAAVAIGEGIAPDVRRQSPDMQAAAHEAQPRPARVSGMGMLLAGFFVRLILVVLVLYGSLRYLEGSVVALAAGLGLGVFSLTVEGLRLVKAWTV